MWQRITQTHLKCFEDVLKQTSLESTKRRLADFLQLEVQKNLYCLSYAHCLNWDGTAAYNSLQLHERIMFEEKLYVPVRNFTPKNRDHWRKLHCRIFTVLILWFQKIISRLQRPRHPKLNWKCYHIWMINRVASICSINIQILKIVLVKFTTPVPSSAPLIRLFSFASLINTPRRHGLSDQNFVSCYVIILLFQQDSKYLFLF